VHLAEADETFLPTIPLDENFVSFVMIQCMKQGPVLSCSVSARFGRLRFNQGCQFFLAGKFGNAGCCVFYALRPPKIGPKLMTSQKILLPESDARHKQTLLEPLRLASTIFVLTNFVRKSN
jgi:hypothetical protein